MSFLAHTDPNAVITGLNDIPADQRPNTFMVHSSFDLMVGSGMLLLLVSGWTGWRWWREKKLPVGRGLLRLVTFSGPFGFIALEAGWFVTELGRQPWVVYGYLRTTDSVTTAPGLLPIFIGFTTLYVALAAIVVWLLRRVAAAKPEGAARPSEIPSEIPN